MLEGIPAWAGDMGPWGLIGVVVIAVLVGKLVPYRTMRDALDAKNDENERLWTALTAQQEITREHGEQLRRLADGQDITVRLIRSGLGATGADVEDA